jgi:hypothetical protein
MAATSSRSASVSTPMVSWSVGETWMGMLFSRKRSCSRRSVCSRRLGGRQEVEGGAVVGVEADVFEVRDWGCTFYVLRCSVIGDGGAGEVEGAAGGGGDDFYGVGVGDVFGRAGGFEGGDGGRVDGVVEGRDECGDVRGAEEGFVALEVDVDVGVGPLGELGDGVDAVGAGGEVGRGEFAGDVEGAAESGDLFGVGGDQDAVELGAGAGGFDGPGEERLAGDDAEELARQAGGGEAGGDDAEGAERHGGRVMDCCWLLVAG